MSGDKTPTPPIDAGGSLPAGVPTMQCPSQCPDMEIQVNNTVTADDDIVFLKCDANRQKIDCRIRAKGSPPCDATVVLTNPDGRLRFPNDADTTTTLNLPINGSWVPFQISGQVGSDAIGDAKIEAHCDQAAGPVKTTIGVTVLWIEPEGLYHLPPAAPAHAVVERLPNVNDLSMLPIADHIAHGTVKFTFKPTAKTAGLSAEWSFTPAGPDGGAMRGAMPAAHNTHLEQEPGFPFDPATMRSTIDASGIAAIRINMPSVAWNRGRLGVRFVDDPGCVTEIDFEVPAVVVIDPGHGGPQVPGTVGGSDWNHAVTPSLVLEKNMTLDFSRLVRDGLNAAIPPALSPRNINVIMTRDADVNLGLAARAHVARDNAADIFLSIHMNGGNGVNHGTSIHIQRPHAIRQISYAQDFAFAGRVIDAVRIVNPASDRIPRRAIRDAGSGVTRDERLGNTPAHQKTRAALFEVDFIDVPAVDVRLNTGPNAAANRQAIADAIRDAIIDDMLNQP